MAAGDQHAAARGLACRRGREPAFVFVRSQPREATTSVRSRIARHRTRAGSDVRVAREAPSRRAGEGHERIRMPRHGRAPLRRGGAARDRARRLPELRRHRCRCRGHVCKCDVATKLQSPRESSVDARSSPQPEMDARRRPLSVSERRVRRRELRSTPAVVCPRSALVRARTAPCFHKFLRVAVDRSDIRHVLAMSRRRSSFASRNAFGFRGLC
jgi:hypothetical protein